MSELPDLVRYWPELTGEAGEYPDDAALVDWYRRTLANLVDVLRSAPADVAAFTFLPAPTPLTMWSRRQASEIAIHRVDAERARGVSSTFEPEFATDMLDELLWGFTPRSGRSIDVASPQVIHVHADDTGDDWYVTFRSDGVETATEGDRADLRISGTASALYVLLWNRVPDSTVTMTGDTDLVDLWRQNIRVRWS